LHGTNVRVHGGGKLSGVDVLLQEGKNLVKQLLLVQIVELQDGVHLVNDQVLMDESWEFLHDGSNEVLVILHANVEVIAGDHLFSVIQAHVEVGHDATDFDSADSVFGVGVVSHQSIILSILLNIGSLDGCKARQ
jgi:hypothetical protein